MGRGVASEKTVLVQEEEKGKGVVAPRVYLSYWAAVGRVLAPAIFLALFLMQGECLIAADPSCVCVCLRERERAAVVCYPEPPCTELCEEWY